MAFLFCGKIEPFMQQSNFFEGLKVVELASVLAGPAVGMFFAELGAEVTKIENKTTGGDVTRKWRLPSESKETTYSAYYCSINWNKKVLMVDLKNLEERTKVLELIKEADIVISNFRKASASKLGMSYEQLKEINPTLIFGLITAYGEEDPTPAFDVVLQAEAGFMYMNGEADGQPVKMPVALIDLLAAHQLKEGLLLALIHKMRTGKGSYVSASLLHSAVASLANQANNWLMGGHIPQRMGTQHPNIAPYGDIFRTKDGKQIILAVGTERQFVGLCNCLKMRLLLEDERFKYNHQRVKFRKELAQILAPVFKELNANSILTELKSKGIPAASIRNMKEVFQQPEIQNMVLTELMEDGLISKRVTTVAFNLKTK